MEKQRVIRGSRAGCTRSRRGDRMSAAAGVRLCLVILAVCTLAFAVGATRARADVPGGTALPGPTPASTAAPIPRLPHGTVADDADLPIVVSPPSRTANRQSVVTLGGITFKLWFFAARDVPIGERPFDSPTPAKIEDDPPKISMRYINGVPYDFPLRQASTGYAALNSYRLTGDTYFLRWAKLQANHLIAIHVTVGDAWFYPATFSYRFSGLCPELLVPPWYQGLAQGIAVGFFARLYEVTGNEAYLDAARHTLKSFLVAESGSRPWVSNPDSSKYLRLEEYPGTSWEYVFNGHMQAALGLWDYYRVTKDPRGLALYKGALTTLIRYGDRFRTPGWVSAYSLGVRAQYIHYHVGVMHRMLQLYTISGDRRFIGMLHRFDADYPDPAVSGTAKVHSGTYAAYRLSSTGAVVSSRTVRADSEQAYNVSRRGRLWGRDGIWLHLTSGALKGYDVREVAGRVYVRGAVNSLDYSPALGVRVGAGQWRATKFDDEGNVTAEKKLDAGSGTTIALRRHAIVNGRAMVQIDGVEPEGDEPDGEGLAGYWLPRRAVTLP